jgi:branched-chain amino acid transport system permease protein
MLLGIPVNVVYTAAFSLGIGIAAFAGALAAPLRGVDPLMGLEALGLAFVVVVMGGMGSFLGTLVAAVLVGIIQSLMTTLWSEGAYLAIYLAMAAVILFRPYGLIGRH